MRPSMNGFGNVNVFKFVYEVFVDGSSYPNNNGYEGVYTPTIIL